MVWEPILLTDYYSPGTTVLSRLPDPRVSQFWDKNHLFAEELARKLESDPAHPKPNCCTQHGIHWDEVAVYPKDAYWDHQLPRASFLNGPVVQASDFSRVVPDLLSK